MGLGLPLQGPGWTEYARVRGYVGVQVNRGRQCAYGLISLPEIITVHVFRHLQHLWSVINGLTQTTRHKLMLLAHLHYDFQHPLP